MTHDTLTPEQWQIEARARRDAQRPKATTKRKGKTPEAKVKAAIDAYLKQIGAINIRTNAGSWQDETGHWIMGAKAGTADNIACIAGAFVAIEAKSATGTQREAQARFQQRVEARGGLYILARSVEDVRAKLAERFGEDTVRGWEAKR
jgi:hypothetical protein